MNYLNTKNSYKLFDDAIHQRIYVDKTLLIEKMSDNIEISTFVSQDQEDLGKQLMPIC